MVYSVDSTLWLRCKINKPRWDGSSKFLQSVVNHLPNFTALRLKKAIFTVIAAKTSDLTQIQEWLRLTGIDTRTQFRVQNIYYTVIPDIHIL
jgi:hypothetical protein